MKNLFLLFDEKDLLIIAICCQISWKEVVNKCIGADGKLNLDLVRGYLMAKLEARQ